MAMLNNQMVYPIYPCLKIFGSIPSPSGPGASPRRTRAAEACEDASAERGELPQGDTKP